MSLRARGFALLPVVLLTALVAAAALLLSRQSAMGGRLAGGAAQQAQARYAAEAALAHAEWLLDRQSGCTGYANLPSTAFEGGSYSATVSPASGSPVAITATGTSAAGASHTLKRSVAKTHLAHTLTLQPGPAGKDSYLEPPSANWSNFGGSDILFLSSTFDYPILEFDLGGLPRGARVTSAQVELYQSTSGTASAGDTVSTQRILRWWKEGTKTGTGTPDGATAVTYDAVNPWASSGGDFEPSAAQAFPWTASTGWKQFDLTAMVQGWVDRVYPNFGFRLLGGATVNNAKFVSGDEAGFTERRPKLTVTFRAPCGWVPAEMVPGTVAHWKLDDGGGTVASDVLGVHNGSVSGGSWITGRVNGALAFNGAGDTVSVAHADTLSLASVTVSAWVNPASVAGRHVILRKGTSTSAANYWLALVDGQIEFGFVNGGATTFNTTGMGLEAGAWRHVAAGYDSATKTVRLFLDGVELSLQGTTKLLLANTESLRLGSGASGEYWSGALDEVRLTGRQVSEAEATLLAGSMPVPAAADANLRVDSINRNFGATTALLVTKSGNRRIVARYDLPAELAGTAVASARLMMYASNVGGIDNANPMLLQATPLVEAWTEGTKNGSGPADGVTWANATETVTWTVAGGTDVPAPAAIAAVPPNFAGGWIEWDVTAIVNDWLAGVRPNHGFLVQNTSNKGDFTFPSREAASATPRLVIYR